MKYDDARVILSALIDAARAKKAAITFDAYTDEYFAKSMELTCEIDAYTAKLKSIDEQEGR